MFCVSEVPISRRCAVAYRLQLLEAVNSSKALDSFTELPGKASREKVRALGKRMQQLSVHRKHRSDPAWRSETRLRPTGRKYEIQRLHIEQCGRQHVAKQLALNKHMCRQITGWTRISIVFEMYFGNKHGEWQMVLGMESRATECQYNT
jgi:hypothetical protein